MTHEIRFEDNIGLVHLQAKNGYRWAKQSGVDMEYEDFVQEASEAFLLAARGFDPNEGVKFSAYYTQVAFSQFRKTIGRMTGVKNLSPTQREQIAERRAENKRRAAEAKAPLPDCSFGIKETRFSDMSVGGDEEFSEGFEATLSSEAQTPEEILELREVLEAAMANLSPLAQVVVQWLQDPPEELVRELQCQEAYADQCTAHGKRTNGLRDGISISNISKFMRRFGNISKREMMLVEAELMKVVDKIEEAYRHGGK